MTARLDGWRGALAMAGALAVSLLASVVACSDGGDAPGVAVLEDAVFTVARPDGTSEELDGLDAWLEAVPFEVVLPDSLPGGVALRNAQLTLPDPRFESMAPFARARATSALLGFSGPGGDAGRGFAVYQTEAADGTPATFGDEGAVANNLPGAEGAQLLDLPMEGGRAQSGTLVLWRACGIDFELSAPGADALSREEVLDLARAFIEGCES